MTKIEEAAPPEAVGPAVEIDEMMVWMMICAQVAAGQKDMPTATRVAIERAAAFVTSDLPDVGIDGSTATGAKHHPPGLPGWRALTVDGWTTTRARGGRLSIQRMRKHLRRWEGK